MITEHQTYDKSEQWEQYKDRGLLILRGVECEFGLWGADGHLLIYGINSDKGIPYTLSDAIRLAKEKNWALAAAHPMSSMCPSSLIDNNFEGVDALEINGRSSLGDNKKTAEVARQLNIPLIGGSDAHDGKGVGNVYTEFQGKICNIQDLVAELKSGDYAHQLYEPPKHDGIFDFLKKFYL